MTNAKLLKLVEELRECDHGFLTVEGGMHFAEPFGLKPHTYVAHANPDDPKGLTLDSGAASAEGVAADVLAGQICRHLGIDYPKKFGRGSQLRVCCDALEQWINKQPTESIK